MRVLVTGRCIPQQPDRCTGQQLQQGFVEAGHDCIFYGNFFGEPYKFLGAEEAATGQFDLIVITEMNDGYPKYPLNTLNLKNTPRVYWDWDVSYHPDLSYQRALTYNVDAYLVGNRYFCGPDGFGRFQKPVLHLPYACSPQIHRKLPDVKKSYALGFIGSLTEERKTLMEMAANNVSNRALIHHADGIYGEDLIRKTNEYYVMFHNNQDACKGLVPGRPWETAGCGTTLLMDYTSYCDFIQFLPEDRYDSVFVYRDETDILAWLNKYAMWERKYSELAMMGEQLMEHVHAHHTYKNRAERIIEWLRKRGLYHDGNRIYCRSEVQCMYGINCL